MDLRNGQITIGEIVSHPAVRRMIHNSKYSMLLNSPMLSQMQGMPLQSALVQARRFVPASMLNKAVAQLRTM